VPARKRARINPLVRKWAIGGRKGEEEEVKEATR
jgi:hypothetical protein